MAEPEITRKEAEKVATLIGPIIGIIDVIERVADTKKMRRILQDMYRQASTLDSLPFPETMNRGEEIRNDAHFFDAVIRLIEARRKQKENVGKKRFSTGSEILKMMGL